MRGLESRSNITLLYPNILLYNQLCDKRGGQIEKQRCIL